MWRVTCYPSAYCYIIPRFHTVSEPQDKSPCKSYNPAAAKQIEWCFSGIEPVFAKKAKIEFCYIYHPSSRRCIRLRFLMPYFIGTRELTLYICWKVSAFVLVFAQRIFIQKLRIIGGLEISRTEIIYSSYLWINVSKWILFFRKIFIGE